MLDSQAYVETSKDLVWISRTRERQISDSNENGALKSDNQLIAKMSLSPTVPTQRWDNRTTWR